ncbi:nitrate- and nitrite sensing domain-containing protein [Streptomyces sp. NPDC058279]|uniref:sensor histidine kinase n=1 Tax=Streptomyces sp. NPDC058279 TaxID=3346418 RepID=UPI0036E6580C
MRSRLVVGVAVAGLTVLAAGAPAVVSATRELNDSQRLVTLAEQAQGSLTLAHLLGDERDAVVEYAAKGRPTGAKTVVQQRVAGTDRQLSEVRADADGQLAGVLGRIKAVRAEAVDGKGGALAAHQAYTAVIAELLAPGDRLAELTPPRAEAALATTRPLAPLGQAVEQASATRGLLLAALAALAVPVPRSEQSSGSAAADELTAAAQRARVREQAALDDFARAARPEVRQTLTDTVTGPEVKTADDYLKRLAERPAPSTADRNPTDRKADAGSVGSALTARIDRMRSVESTLAGRRSTALATLRDDDVQRLELLVAFLGVLFLLVVGVSTAVARSLTRPLSVLRRGAERLATPEGSVEPVRFTGRNDEFAQVVGHLNAVRDQTVALHTKIAGLDADRRRLIGRNEALSSGRGALETELKEVRARLEAELEELRAGLEEHRRIMSTTSVSLSLRTLGLVERQLAVIEELESKEQEPERLATLFKLDHLATVMRRHNENLLVLAGQEHGHGQALPVPLVDVLRAAVSEIERYERVDLAALPSYTQVAGHAADDISHVLAELLENATTFSPPDAKVKVSGRLLDSGEVVLSVLDEGIGVTADRLESLNARLATPEAYDEEPEAEHGLGLGLYVAGRLAARHGVTAELRAGRHGGTEALVVVPAALLPTAPPTSPVHTLATPGLPEFRLPGVIAEANENTLPPRVPPAPEPAPPVADPGAGAAPEVAAGAGSEPAPGEAAREFPAAESDGAADGPLPDADQDARATAPQGPSTGSAADAGRAEPAEELPTRVVPEAGEGTFEAPAGQLPPAEQVFTAAAPAAGAPGGAGPEEELLARVVPAPDAVAFAVPDAAPGSAEPLPETAPGADVQPEPGSAPARPDTDPADAAPHGRAAAEDNWLPRQGNHGHPEEAVTDKGLPKRTPRPAATAPTTDRPAGARPEPRRVDADELRRRLGGFYQGSQDGRRVAAAELAQDRGSGRDQDSDRGQGRNAGRDRDRDQDQRRQQGQTDRGDTAQEART